MDDLHNVIRNIRESKAKRDHLSVVREFLGHLDRIGRRPPKVKAVRGKGGKGGGRRGR